MARVQRLPQIMIQSHEKISVFLDGAKVFSAPGVIPGNVTVARWGFVIVVAGDGTKTYECFIRGEIDGASVRFSESLTVSLADPVEKIFIGRGNGVQSIADTQQVVLEAIGDGGTEVQIVEIVPWVVFRL